MHNGLLDIISLFKGHFACLAWHGMALGVHPNLQIVKEHI
jgi:hypothetical protein